MGVVITKTEQYFQLNLVSERKMGEVNKFTALTRTDRARDIPIDSASPVGAVISLPQRLFQSKLLVCVIALTLFLHVYNYVSFFIMSTNSEKEPTK